MERAGHLPGLDPAAIAWRETRFSAWGQSVDVALPVLSSAQAQALGNHVRSHAESHLRQLPVMQIVETIDRAIARLLDRDDPYRKRAEAILPILTGYDAQMVRLALTGYLKSFRKPQLLRFLTEDFGNPLLLDGFQPRPKGGLARAVPPGLLLHVWAGNVPGLPLWSLISGLLVKAGNIGKVASAEPLMAGWFAQLLAEIDPQLGECLAVTWWKGGEEAGEKPFLDQADTVIAYGGNASLEALRARLPVTTRFLPHGHKLAFGAVAASALDRRRAPVLARLAAQDVVRYEQQGCYSPQVIYVARGGRVAPRDFAGMIGQELAGLGRSYGRRALSLTERGALANWRHAAEMQGGEVIAGEDWAILYRDTPEPLWPSALNRTLRVVAVEGLDAVAALVAPSRAFLQTATVAADPEELLAIADNLAGAGVNRIAGFGQAGLPEAGWHHDGRFSLLDLVGFAEVDAAAEQAAETFARYVD